MALPSKFRSLVSGAAGFRYLVAGCAAVLCGGALAGQLAEPRCTLEDVPPSVAERANELWGRWEVKRQNTSRGTPEESTKTTLRLEKFLDGPVNLLRVDLPLPDEKTDFAGDPFHPRLGDVKVRTRFRSMCLAGNAFSTFAELTFPTADPKSLGGGRYQLSAGVRTYIPFAMPETLRQEHRARVELELEQVKSLSGDPAFPEVSYTKLEFTFFDLWRGRYTFKLKFKPNVDWTRDGKVGTVGEIEGGLLFGNGWRTWLMLGHRLQGPGVVKGTYEDRVEFGVTQTF